MIREKVRTWGRTEREKLASMTLKKKWGYIWTYYKWWVIGFVLVLGITVSSVWNAQSQRRAILVSGMFINTSTSADGYAFVNEDYHTYAGADEETRVELVEARTICFHAEQSTSDDVNAILSIDAQISTKALDYIIGDVSAMEFYDGLNVLLDLETLFTPEQLSGLQTVRTESGIVAIDLAGSTLAKQFGLSAEPTYIFFLANTPRRDNCIAFLDYLFRE